MNRRSLLFGGIAVVVLGVFAFWYVALRSDAPPPVSLDDAVAAVATTGAAGDDVTTTAAVPDTTGAPADPASSDEGFSGSWGIVAEPSFVGYRVGEELAGIGTTEAAGRTSEVFGELILDGTTITVVDVEADLRGLESDSSTRDGALRSRGLETDTFPSARFSLTEPIEIEEPAVGETITATAVGDLTLHGVTNQVSIPIEGTLVDDETIVVVGSLVIALADYDIEPPTGMRVLSIEDTGTIEMQLAFSRSQ